MQFLYIAFLLAAFTAAVPIYQVEVVTVTHYTTIIAEYDEPTSTSPQTTQTTIPDITPTTQTTELPATSPLEGKAAVPLPETQASSTVESSIETSSTSSGETFAGQGTYYDTGLGACGWTNSDTDYIVAIGHGLFDQYTPNGNPNNNSLCGRKIIAHHEGNSVEVTAVDRCEGCQDHDLDFSPAAFEKIADMSLGRIQITWEWA